MKDIVSWRIAVFLFGCAFGALGARAAWEYALLLEGGIVTYFVLGAPMVTIMVAIIPPLASMLWKTEGVISFGLWLLLIPCAAFLFFTSAERVHKAKETQAAELRAGGWAMARAQSEFDEAKLALPGLEQVESKLKRNSNCSKSAVCQSAIALAESGRQKLDSAEKILSLKQKGYFTDSPFKAPTWLLPLCMDLGAFLLVWAGLSGPWVLRDSRPKPTAEEAKGWLLSVLEAISGQKKPKDTVA